MSQASGNTPLELARSAWAGRDIFGAKWFIDQALALGGDVEHMARVHLTAGVIQREYGDLAVAESHLTRLIDESHLYPQSWPVLEGFCHYNLGLTYRQRRQYLESVRHYRIAVGAFQRESMTRFLTMTWQNLAWVLCLMEDAPGALEALEEAQQTLDRTDRELYWQQRIGHAHCALVDDDAKAVLSQTEAIITGEGAHVDVLSQAMWLRGRALLALGRVDEAADVANRGLLWATQTKDTRCVLDISDLLRRVREHTVQRATGA